MTRILSMILFAIILSQGVTPPTLYAQVNDDQNKSDRTSYSHFTKISKEDFVTKYFYIPDSSVIIKPEISYITSTRIDKLGSNRKAPEGLRTIFPYKIDREVFGTYYLNTKLICIPFYGGIDGESTLFTFWRIENDSLLFDHLYQDIFLTKYAHTFIDTVLTFGSMNILIGNTIGGEGGESWKELWIAKEISDTRVAICQRYIKGWESDGEIRYTLDYGLTSHNINIQIVEHSLKISSTHTWDTISSRIVINEHIDLTTILSKECR